MSFRVISFIGILMLKISVCQASRILVTTETEFDNSTKNAIAGDTIVLKNGIWENIELKFYASGEKEKPIVLTAESPGKVVLTGTSILKIYGEYLEVHDLDFKDGHSYSEAVISFRKSSKELAKNCRLTNCRILNYNPTSDETAYKWVSIYGQNNRVDHCKFDGKNHEGALLVVWLNETMNNHRIDHNYFTNIQHLGRNGAETIRIGTSSTSLIHARTIVEYNLFEDCDGEIEIISNKSEYNTYRYNTFRNNDGTLTLRHANNCEVYGNFFFGHPNKASGGVRIIGEGHKVYNNYFQDLKGTSYRATISMVNGIPNSLPNLYHQVKNAEVVHNTIVGCREPFNIGIGAGKDSEQTLSPENCIIANNIVDKVTGDKVITYTDIPTNIKYYSNYFHHSNIGISNEGIFNQDPELIFSEEIWRPSNSSNVIDASLNIFQYVTSDIDGHPRDQAPDIGSDEISASDMLIFPLTADDVGYQWNEDTILNTNEVLKAPFQFQINSGKINIHGLKDKNTTYKLAIYNLQGTKMLEIPSIQNGEHNIEPNLNGIYIILITNNSNKNHFSEKVFLGK